MPGGVMPGGAQGHNEVMMMYVGLKNGYQLIWGKLCAFSLFHTMHMYCRNPNLAKCGGEAQHLEKLGIWNPPGLSNV